MRSYSSVVQGGPPQREIGANTQTEQGRNTELAHREYMLTQRPKTAERFKRARENWENEGRGDKRGKGVEDYYEDIMRRVEEFDRLSESVEYEETGTSETNEELRKEAQQIYEMLQKEREQIENATEGRGEARNHITKENGS